MICASPAVSLPNEDANEPIFAVHGLRERLPAHIHDLMPVQPKYKFKVPACIDWGTSRRTSPEWDSFGAIEATPLTPPCSGNSQ